MIGQLFREYLRWFDIQMTGRKALLLLDCLSSHHAGVDLPEVQEIELTNDRLEFLPANTTSICQPLDHGIRQLETLEREKKALQMSRRSQTTLERFFIAKQT